MIVPAILLAVGACAIVWARQNSGSVAVQLLGFIFALVGVFLITIAVVFLTTPRLAYSSGNLLVGLRFGAPYRVPIQFVECVFLGKQAGHLPGQAGTTVPVQNLVIRLSEKAQEYHHREVKPALGSWSDGYISIHGAWCERLNFELVQRLNSRLAELQKAEQSKG
jgi:hypothetical protein